MAGKDQTSFLEAGDADQHVERRNSAHVDANHLESDCHVLIARTGRRVLACTIFAAVAMVASILSAFYSRHVAQSVQQSSISMERAFITVPRLEVTKGPDGLRFAPVIENNGQTPTRSLKVIALAQPNDDSIGPVDPEVAFARGRPATFLVGPHATITVPIAASSDLSVSNASLKKVKPRQMDSYVFGTIHYRDIFDETPLHITKYCFHIGPDGDHPQDTDVSYHYCRFLNCADHECTADKKERERAEAQTTSSK
jgi:hypothetical protein